ncbi:MAG: hypothetical protein CMQ20_08375 [Gammaproteobacteria bacterium]|nr:hypothetical protein [Gammaproteobacteria bacterium]
MYLKRAAHTGKQKPSRWRWITLNEPGKDYIEIIETKYRYAYGLDNKDWDLYRSIFLDEITMDFSSYSGVPGTTQSADEWIASCKMLFEGLDATQHQMSNPLVEIKGDEARLRMYIQAEHFLLTSMGSDSYALGGYYDDQLVRTEDGWKIAAVTINVNWNRGNRHIMQLAIEKKR